MSSQNLVDFHAPRLSVEAEDLGRRPCCCRVRQIYPWGYTDQHLGRENWIECSDKGGEGVAPPSCSQSYHTSKLLNRSCLVYPIEEKHFIYRAPVSEGGGQDSTPSKGDAAGILSEFQISIH